MNHVWETDEKIMLAVITVLGLVAIAIAVMLVLDWMREDRETREWRAGLKRGSRVRVEGMTDVQMIWNVDGEDAIIRVFTEGGDWFKKVRVADVWPEKDAQEWEIVNE